MKGEVNRMPVNILVDTGAAATVLSEIMWDRINNSRAQLQSSTEWRLVGVQGTLLHLHGSTQVELELPPEKFPVDMIVSDTSADVILGCDISMVRGAQLTLCHGNATIVALPLSWSNSYLKLQDSTFLAILCQLTNFYGQITFCMINTTEIVTMYRSG